jgi:hypothetical protein
MFSLLAGVLGHVNSKSVENGQISSRGSDVCSPRDSTDISPFLQPSESTTLASVALYHGSLIMGYHEAFGSRQNAPSSEDVSSKAPENGS